MTPLEKQQQELLLACRVILAELVEAEPEPVYTSREQAILAEIEEVLNSTKPADQDHQQPLGTPLPPPSFNKAW